MEEKKKKVSLRSLRNRLYIIMKKKNSPWYSCSDLTSQLGLGVPLLNINNFIQHHQTKSLWTWYIKTISLFCLNTDKTWMLFKTQNTRHLHCRLIWLLPIYQVQLWATLPKPWIRFIERFYHKISPAFWQVQKSEPRFTGLSQKSLSKPKYYNKSFVNILLLKCPWLSPGENSH